jgi:hypothetical protein
MLGEAARTHEDAERYAEAYRKALDRIARDSKDGFQRSPGISVKLTALHPRFEFAYASEAVAAILPVMRELALKAAKADVHLTIDAEEADRLELQLDVFEALLADDALFANGWRGFGIAIQAYQKRAVPLCGWVAEAARAHGRKLMVRLVKGAYWDTEIKAAQVAGPPTDANSAPRAMTAITCRGLSINVAAAKHAPHDASPQNARPLRLSQRFPVRTITASTTYPEMRPPIASSARMNVLKLMRSAMAPTMM